MPFVTIKDNESADEAKNRLLDDISKLGISGIKDDTTSRLTPHVHEKTQHYPVPLRLDGRDIDWTSVTSNNPLV